jgi:hypothetical protein
MPGLGGVEHHRRTVDRGQGAVGVLAEILVARHVKQVEGKPPCSKLRRTTRGRHSPIAKEAQGVILDTEATGNQGLGCRRRQATPAIKSSDQFGHT